MSEASASPEEIHDEEQVDIDGGVDLDEEVDDASADPEEEEDEEEKAQGLDLDVEVEAQEEDHSGSQEDQDVDVLNGEHEHQITESEFVPADEDAHVGSEDMKEDDKEEKEGEKSGELLKRPPHGSEVFVGGITRDTTDEDLRTLCSCCGDIYEVCCLSYQSNVWMQESQVVLFYTMFC